MLAAWDAAMPRVMLVHASQPALLPAWRRTTMVSLAGPAPEVVLEAMYGWYWPADVLAEAVAVVHLAHPLGIKGFTARRVKNDWRDAAEIALVP
jgi:transposase